MLHAEGGKTIATHTHTTIYECSTPNDIYLWFLIALRLSPSIVVYVPCNWFVFLSLNTPEEGAFTSKTDSANAALTLCPEQKPARKKVNRKTEAMRSDKKPKMTSADDGNEGCD